MGLTASRPAPGRPAVWRSRLWTAIIVVGPVICFLIVVLLNLTPGTIVVQDPRFQVLGHRIATGADRVIYFDLNQTLSRVNQWLRRTTGLDLLHRGSVTFSTPPKAYAFLLRYRGQIDLNELRNLEAFLTAPNGWSQELHGTASSDSPRTVIKCFFLMDAPTNPGPYRLVLKLPSTGKPVATWGIEHLR